jgi:hypothetical protein
MKLLSFETKPPNLKVENLNQTTLKFVCGRGVTKQKVEEQTNKKDYLKISENV